MALQLNSIHLPFLPKFHHGVLVVMLCCKNIVRRIFGDSFFPLKHIITFTNTSWFFWSIFHALKFALFFFICKINSPRSIYQILTWLQGFLVIFLYLVKSLLGIARQRSLEKFAILSLKPQRHVRILIDWSLRLGRCYVEWHHGNVLWDELERRSVTTRYHGSKISGSQQ